MEMTRGERYVRLMGALALAHPWAPVFLGVCGLLPLIAGLFGATFDQVHSLPLIFMGGASLIAAVLWYERQQFYRVIQELEAELEQQRALTTE